MLQKYNQIDAAPLAWEWTNFEGVKFYEFDGVNWQGPYQLADLKELLDCQKMTPEQIIYEGEFKTPHQLGDVIESQKFSQISKGREKTESISNLTRKFLKEPSEPKETPKLKISSEYNEPKPSESNEYLASSEPTFTRESEDPSSTSSTFSKFSTNLEKIELPTLPTPPGQINSAKTLKVGPEAPVLPPPRLQFALENSEQTLTSIPTYEQWASKYEKKSNPDRPLEQNNRGLQSNEELERRTLTIQNNFTSKYGVQGRTKKQKIKFQSLTKISQGIIKFVSVIILAPLFGLTGLYGTKLVLEWLDPIATEAEQMAEYQLKQQPEIVTKDSKNELNKIPAPSEKPDSFKEPNSKQEKLTPQAVATATAVVAPHTNSNNLNLIANNLDLSKSNVALPPTEKSALPQTPSINSGNANNVLLELAAAKGFYFKVSGASAGFPVFNIKVVKPHLEKIVLLLESIPNETVGVEQYFKGVTVEARSQDWLSFGPFHQQQEKLADGLYQVSVIAVHDGRQIESIYSEVLKVGALESKNIMLDRGLKTRQAQAIKESLRGSKNNLLERIQQVETWLHNSALDEKSISSESLPQLLDRFNSDWPLKWSELEQSTQWYKGNTSAFSPRFWDAELEWMALLSDIKILNENQSPNKSVTVQSFKKLWQKIKSFRSLVEQLDPKDKWLATDGVHYARRVLSWQQN